MKQIRMIFQGGVGINMDPMPDTKADEMVAKLLACMRGDRDPVFTIVRPDKGPQHFNASKLLVIEVHDA